MSSLYFLLFVGVLSNVGYSLPQPHHDSCNAGETYWCKSIDTATYCGVEAYCRLNHPDFNMKKHTTTAEPVKIDLYYESFCGGCKDFILNQLFPAYQKLYSTGIFEIGLYPYGNAEEKQVGDKWVFECQHGEQECQVNVIETCAINLLREKAAFMPFIHCIESQPSLENAKYCADNLKVDWEPISTCYNGTQGNNWEHEMGVKTNALIPQHYFVPWITANNKHTDDIQNAATGDLISFICETYTGVKPHACRVHKRKENICLKKLFV